MTITKKADPKKAETKKKLDAATKPGDIPNHVWYNMLKKDFDIVMPPNEE